MVYEELNEILTENEKQVYLALLQLGEVTASPILEKTGLQNSVFYRTIHRLMEKGFVSYILKGKIKHFKANSPELFISQLKERTEKLKEIIPKLKEFQKLSETKAEAEVFIGVKGIIAMYNLLIEDSKPHEKYYFFGPTEEVFTETMAKVYIPFRKFREERKIEVYGLMKKSLKGKVNRFKRTYEKYVDFLLPPNMAIFQDKIVMVSWGEIPTGILIKAKDIAEQYRELFLEIWKIAEN